MQPRVSTSETTGTISLLLEMRLPVSTWENNEMMSSPWANLREVHWKATYIAGLILLLAITTWFTPPRAIELHNILHHLNFLPFMIAGMIFGWRGALWALLFALLVQAPSIVRHWTWWPMDAQDQLVELSIFGAAGVIAGFLADRSAFSGNVWRLLR
jgi:glucose-6-phosphate-specific signal transduction histidine kinase